MPSTPAKIAAGMKNMLATGDDHEDQAEGEHAAREQGDQAAPLLGVQPGRERDRLRVPIRHVRLPSSATDYPGPARGKRQRCTLACDQTPDRLPACAGCICAERSRRCWTPS